MRFEGRVWRYLPAGAHPLHFRHLIHAGGRWNRRGLYGCLYTALAPSGAAAEHEKHERRRGLARPRDLVALDVWVDPVFDLASWLEDPRPIRVPGLPGPSRPPDLSDGQAAGDEPADLEACRHVADWARTHGFVALLAPSAALEGGRVLAIYPENAPRNLRLLETGVRHPLNYGDRALLDARGELGMTVSEAAERLGVARPTLSQLVNERKRVSPEMALRLGRLFGNGTEIWVNLQARYDRWEVEHDPRALEEADRVRPVHA